MNLDFALGKTLMELEELCQLHHLSLPEGYKKRFLDNRKQLEDEFQEMTQKVTIPCSNNHQKLIFLAYRLGVIEPKKELHWFEMKELEPVTLMEISLIDAAFQFTFHNKEIYLVIRNTFWKVETLKELIIHHQYEGSYACKIDEKYQLYDAFAILNSRGCLKEEAEDEFKRTVALLQDQFQKCLPDSANNCDLEHKKQIFLSYKLRKKNPIPALIDYGYTWTGMNPLTLIEAAYRFAIENRSVYLLYCDNTEAEADSLGKILYHYNQGGVCGFEKEQEKGSAALGNNSVISVSTFATTQEQKESLIFSDYLRLKTLECCYQIPGYEKLPLVQKNVLYDSILDCIKNS